MSRSNAHVSSIEQFSLKKCILVRQTSDPRTPDVCSRALYYSITLRNAHVSPGDQTP